MDNMNYTLLSGSSFKEFYGGIEFIKVTNKEGTEKYNHKLKDGLNELPLKQSYGYIDGGIKFYELDNLFDALKRVYDSEYILKVEIPDDANVFIDDKEYMADKLILKDKVLLKDLEYWNDITFCEKAIKFDPKFLKYCKSITQEKLLELVKQDAYIIEYIMDPTEEMINIAVDKFPYLIKYVKDPPLELLKKVAMSTSYVIKQCFNLSLAKLFELVKFKPESLEYINNPSYEMCEEAVKKDPMLLKHVPINYRTEELCNMAFNSDIRTFPFLNKKFITHDMCIDAVKFDGALLKYVPDVHFTNSVCIEAIKQKPIAIDHIKNPTIEMWKVAITSDPSIIFDLKNPSDEMLLLAAPKYPSLYDKIKNKSLIIQGDGVDVDFLLNNNPNYITNIKNPSYQQCLTVIKKSAKLINYIPLEHQSEELCMIAVQDYPESIKFMEKQTDSIALTAVLQRGRVLQFVKNKTDDICEAAVDNDGTALEFVDNQTDIIIKKAFLQNTTAFKFIKNKTYEIIEYACSIDHNLIEFIINPSDPSTVTKYQKIIMDALKKKGTLLKHIPIAYQTPEICQAAIDNDPYAVESMDPTLLSEDLAIKIVSKNGSLLRIIKNQTPKICMEAIKNYPQGLYYVNNQTEELCMTALQLNHNTLVYIKDQTPEICFTAVSKDYTTMYNVNNNDEMVIKFCCVIDPRCVYYVKDLTIKNECYDLLRDIEALI